MAHPMLLAGTVRRGEGIVVYCMMYTHYLPATMLSIILFFLYNGKEKGTFFPFGIELNLYRFYHLLLNFLQERRNRP